MAQADGPIKLSTDQGSLSAAVSQGDFRQQVANLTDLLRQVVGDAEVRPGDAKPSLPLNATFELFVDPVRGTDTFAHGDYGYYDPPGATVDEKVKNKLNRITQQRMTCGYTRQRPFRTINRAAIEAAIITSRNWFFNDPKTHVDCIVIYLSAGVHIAYNDPGTGAVTAWPDRYDPTPADLIAFNPPEGGIILPRYASIQGADLRKCTIRPTFVPPSVDEAADYSNRSCFFRVTPGALCFGFSFFDSWTEKRSHHLLSCFEFASQTMLDAFYAKVNTACVVGGDLDPNRLKSRPSEYGVVSPEIDQNNAPSEKWDVVSSSSAYVYNCSIRSEYGIAGIFGNGNLVGGFKSFVSAQFTGVSLQRDLSCWLVYKGGNWVEPATYQEYIDADPDDIKMNPKRMSRHISMVNGAFAQLVSVFAIGQGIHHFTDNGGEITITNSNSSFGGCAAQSKGYRANPYPIDQNWDASFLKRPLNISAKPTGRRRIELGNVAVGVANNATVLQLKVPLQASKLNPAIPAVLDKDGYSLRPGTLIWVANRVGPDWYAVLAADAWDPLRPDGIRVNAPFKNEDNDVPGAANPAFGNEMPDLEESIVFIRRIRDTRTKDERLISLQLSNTSPTRKPVRDFILQLDASDASVTAELNKTSELLLVNSTLLSTRPNAGVNTTAEITLRRGGADVIWTANTYYRAGDTVKRDGKHWTCIRKHLSTSAFETDRWEESYVHMDQDFNPEDFFKNEGQMIVFDSDTEALEDSTTLGYDWTTAWTTDVDVARQYESTTDYRGMKLLLRALGVSAAGIRTMLLPQAENERAVDLSVGVSGVTAPADKVTGWGNWRVKFHRPSIIRLFSHAWEWAGWLNYSKSLPAVQRELSPQNKFNYYFTNDSGGRVYGTGNNEDGFGVTPFGLTDLSTGEVDSVEAIGAESPDFDFLPANQFDSLTVGELTVQSINPGGPLLNAETFVPKATTAQYGIVQLATMANIDNKLPARAVTSDQLVFYRGKTPPQEPAIGDIWVDTNGFPQTYIWSGAPPQGSGWWMEKQPLRIRDAFVASFLIVPRVAGGVVTVTARPTGHDTSNCLIDWGDGAITKGAISGTHVYARFEAYRLSFQIRPGAVAIFDGNGWPTLSGADWLEIGPFSQGTRINNYFWGGPLTRSVNFTDTLEP